MASSAVRNAVIGFISTTSYCSYLACGKTWRTVQARQQTKLNGAEGETLGSWVMQEATANHNALEAGVPFHAA